MNGLIVSVKSGGNGFVFLPAAFLFLRHFAFCAFRLCLNSLNKLVDLGVARHCEICAPHMKL